ncbi:hypothetical protein NGR_b16820 (plasmid) [Sinorhizobium fredii NGR234]|uniref:SPW repeat-containing integral membrane domain-containing protein n=1 Tax=Sinorhizobium fredii (strain NBRC 101917 / NGR234) TaxID=394 RepID=Q6W232_SINFN|nr:SPW repeat protein [Sinorhizobium fredii]AAQ87186.1 Hypothetical protein RNGR00162 [Sinorhizobium fredii NGR234]ACP23133.1 hypothetical protein NGR_b16820 [Sinorhizobium fredii NGR234]
MKSEVPSKSLEWSNLVLGAAFVCAAYMFGGQPVAAWNAAITGTLMVCCSAVALTRYGAWVEWSNLLLGSWAVVAPFLLGFGSQPVAMWTHVLLGLCVATIAAIQLAAARRPSPRASS